MSSNNIEEILKLKQKMDMNLYSLVTNIVSYTFNVSRGIIEKNDTRPSVVDQKVL